MTSPSGEPSPKHSLHTTIPEGDVGEANVVVNLAIPVKEFGRFVVDLSVDGESRARIPFMLLEQSPPTPAVLH